MKAEVQQPAVTRKVKLAQQAKSLMGFTDSLVNFAANLGTSKDKLMHSIFRKTRTRLDAPTLEAMYRETGLVGKIVDIIPHEMTREWRSFADSGLEEEQIDLIVKAEKEFSVRLKFKDAKTWARLYGGSLIVMNVEGTGEPWEPLNLDAVKPGSLKALTVYDSENAHYSKINNLRPLEANFNKPETYRLTNSQVEIHHTRVLRFDGQPLPFNEFRRNRYWNDSVINRIYDSFINLDSTLTNIAGMVFEANVDIVKVKNLMTNLATSAGTDLLTDRFFIAKMLKANNNITLLDADEDYQKSSQNFANLDAIARVFMIVVSAIADVPATRLFGEAAKGLNNGGEENTRNFYDHIKSRQTNEFDDQLHYLDQILARHLGLDPEKMDYDWNRLWQLSDKETAEVQKSNSERDRTYYDMGMPFSKILTQLMEEDVYTDITPQFIKEVEKLEKEAAEAYEESLENEDDDADLENEEDETQGDETEKEEDSSGEE